MKIALPRSSLFTTPIPSSFLSDTGKQGGAKEEGSEKAQAHRLQMMQRLRQPRQGCRVAVKHKVGPHGRPRHGPHVLIDGKAVQRHRSDAFGEGGGEASCVCVFLCVCV